MISIERTAYPRLNINKVISQKNLYISYTLNLQELDHINNTVRTNKLRLYYSLQLKVFQNLGYFIEIDQIPSSISSYVRKQLGFAHNIQMPLIHASTFYRHRQSIQQYLGIIPWELKGSESGLRFAIKSAFQASQTLNMPADIVNVVIEELRNNHFELPSFNTLCRLIKHVRYRVNRTLFHSVFEKLQQQNKLKTLEDLLKVPEGKIYSSYQMLKQPPKTPRINDFKELIRHHIWLLSFGDMVPFIKEISIPKRLQFSQEAKSLDISNLMDISEEKRYTLIACLIDYTQKKTKDNLAEVFCKTISTIHKRARTELATLRENNTDQTQELAYFVRHILGNFKDNDQDPNSILENIKVSIESKGGVEEMIQSCDHIIACNSKQHHPLLWKYFKVRRSALFDVLENVQLGSSTQNEQLIKALKFLISHRYKRLETLQAPEDLNLSFISETWHQLVYEGPQKRILNRRFFEVCIFTYISYELHSGDVFIEGADEFSDYRDSLFTLEECEKILEKNPEELKLFSNGKEFFQDLKEEFTKKAQEFDDLYPQMTDFVIDDKGVPFLKKVPTQKPTPETLELVAQIQEHMPERNLLDILCLTHHSTDWAHSFGPISGSETRLENPLDRYILNTFCYGTGMGPTQTAKHVRTYITPHMLSWINHRHVNIQSLNQAKDRVVNYTKDFSITKAWGDGSRCAADGTLRDIYEDNIVAEDHFRYTAKGGIAYIHVGDTYVVLCGTFDRCGLWEGIFIIDGLQKNESLIKPKTVHADTQGQSTVIFGLSHLLGIKLMPRIRNWKDLKFFRPDKNIIYKNVDSFFSEVIDWNFLETHCKDFVQILLSIKYGKISTVLLLKKLGTYSRKNRLYQAFQELGRVIRTMFLLEYLSSRSLREIITETTNKVEAYNALSDWVCFASKVIVASNDPDEMEKAIKYNLLVCNCIILENIIDLTDTIHKLQSSNIKITKEDISRLSPYMTSHIKRFGDYVFDPEMKPKNVEKIKNL